MKRFLRIGISVLLTLLLLLSAGASYADEVVFGDADGDGEVTAQDASCIQRHLTHFLMMDAAAMSRADYDGDGEVTERDSSLILSSFMSPDFSVPVTHSFSMLFTSDLRGNAWDPSASDDRLSCTAMNTAACIQTLREQDPALLLFDVGSSIFGSSIADDYTELTERSRGPITSLFYYLHYDAVLLGDEAFTYPSQMLRKEVNELVNHHVPVIGANLLKADPTIFDAAGTLWNEILPYVILEIQEDEQSEPLRIAVIGMTQPDLAPSYDEITPADPLEIYAKLRKQLKGTVDYTILLYHGNVEADVQAAGSFSLRDFLKKTDSIDLVIAAHNGGSGVRSERNASGDEIPIVLLPGGAETVTKVSVSTRAAGRPAILVEAVDASQYQPNDTIRGIVRPYVSKLSGVMDAVVCTVAESIDPFRAQTPGSSDCMEIIHEMQLFAAQKWIDTHDVDLPNELISVAYPYIPFGGYKEGVLTYRDLYVLSTETPFYTLMLIRGSELRAWLSSYAETLMQDDPIYSLYGLSYLLNSLNADMPLGFLEYSSGRSVDDDEVFTLILAEREAEDLHLRDYIDSSWMTYEDRLVDGFTLPVPEKLKTLEEKPIIDALAAYLESIGTLKLKHLFSWIIL